jgi:transposase
MASHRKIIVPLPNLVERYLEQEANPEVRLRLALLNLIGKLDRQMTLEEICDLLKVPVSTAYVWVRAWKDEGYPGIVHPCRTTERPPGRPPTLDGADLERLKTLLSERPHWTTQEVCDLIERTWDVTLSPSQAARILKDKLRMRFSKPYPHDYRRPDDAEEQLRSALDGTYKQLIEKGYSPERIALGLLDEASPQTTANTARFWHFGNPPMIRNTTRYKANAIGFYAIRGRSVNGFLADSTGDSISRFLTEIREANRDAQAVVLVLDNFTSHHSAAVCQTAETLGISLVYLPAHSPDLNPIEFIWKTVKRTVSLNFIFSLDDLRALISEVWGESAIRLSFAKKWIEEFAPIVLSYKYFCG